MQADVSAYRLSYQESHDILQALFQKMERSDRGRFEDLQLFGRIHRKLAMIDLAQGDYPLAEHHFAEVLESVSIVSLSLTAPPTNRCSHYYYSTMTSQLVISLWKRFELINCPLHSLLRRPLRKNLNLFSTRASLLSKKDEPNTTVQLSSCRNLF
jgi:hypothetical protein